MQKKPSDGEENIESDHLNLRKKLQTILVHLILQEGD